MATTAEQAVIDAARTLYNDTDGHREGEHLDTLGHALVALAAEQAPPPPYVADQQCAYLDHHHWIVATVEKIEPHPERPGYWVLDLCVNAPHGSEHRMTKTVDDKGVGENVAPMRDR